MVYSLFSWCEKLPISRVIRGSVTLFPAIEVIHLFGLVMLLGTTVILDLRLMGYGNKRQSIPTLAAALSLWTHLGLVIMAVTGFALFLSEAVKCYENPAFWLKMSFLASALLFQFTVYRRVTSSEGVRAWLSRTTAVTSLLLWFGVGLAGRAIAFV